MEVSLTQNDIDAARCSPCSVSWEPVDQSPRHHQSWCLHEWTYSASGMSAEPSAQLGENPLQVGTKTRIRTFPKYKLTTLPLPRGWALFYCCQFYQTCGLKPLKLKKMWINGSKSELNVMIVQQFNISKQKTFHYNLVQKAYSLVNDDSLWADLSTVSLENPFTTGETQQISSSRKGICQQIACQPRPFRTISDSWPELVLELVWTY